MEQAGKSRRGDGDRISSLPDCLIHLIMSFLTAHEAVRTCVLSKRWKNLWTTLPFLDFDLWKFKSDGQSDDTELEEGGHSLPNIKFEKFLDFVCMTLLLRKASNLDTFYLSCRELCEWPEYNMFIRSWFLYALNHNPRVLKIEYPLDGSVPLALFTCASLVDVSFSCFIGVPNFKVINLPCLRRLHLSDGDLTHGFIEKLFSGCPMLEFFHVEFCGRELYSINSQSLKYLKAKCCNNKFWREAAEKEIVLINTPNLLSFRDTIFLDFKGPKFLLKMPSLISANIRFERSRYERSYDGKSNILLGLSNVQNLKLTGPEIKVLLETEMPNCSEFTNLKDLSVEDLCLTCHCNLLASFLNHCPNLKKLSLYHLVTLCEEETHGNQEALKIASFKGKVLETVEVKFARCDKSFPQVMKYLQDITKNSGAQINMTTQFNRSPPDCDVGSSEQDSE
ncbi:FBD-associated F-box protein [Rhynchospora pubera]|uniref:FBD-associated F-box protein n=1 Tax=Rhynchospora pubera TaxID=906938 RepID=A0AAV8G6G2_9POAL|nr:FBD-associated F-box protein [Rhynchospora pubera]